MAASIPLAQVTFANGCAEMNSPVRPYTPDEVQKVQEQLQSFYDDFVEKAAQSRGSTTRFACT